MTARWGCWNTPRKDGYWVRNGTVPVQDDVGFGPQTVVEAQLLRWHEDTGSRECQHRKSTPSDPKCVGCHK